MGEKVDQMVKKFERVQLSEDGRVIAASEACAGMCRKIRKLQHNLRRRKQVIYCGRRIEITDRQVNFKKVKFKQCR